MAQRFYSSLFFLLPVSFAAVAVVSFNGCKSEVKSDETASEEQMLVVAVSNYPLSYFVQRIASDNVEVSFPVEADVDPAFWKPSADAIKKMQDADLVLFNGAGYESWRGSVTLAESKTVDTCFGSKDELIEVDTEVVHQHGSDGEHSHKGTAFTTWLDPDIAVAQANSVRRALVDVSPYHQATFDDNYRELKSDLRDLRNEMVRVGKSLQGQHLMGSHPVYQYLQRTMKLDMHSVHFEPDQEPTAEQWAEFDKMVAEHPTKIMLWEASPLASVTKQLEQRGIKVIVFSQLGNQPAEGDLLSELNKSLFALESAALAVSIDSKNDDEPAKIDSPQTEPKLKSPAPAQEDDGELKTPSQAAEEEDDQ